MYKGKIMKKLVLAVSILSMSVLVANDIDLDKYVVKIVKNASKSSVRSAIKELKFTYGMDDSQVKVLDKVDVDCISLGLKKTDIDNRPDRNITIYKKELEPDVEAVCEEAVYQDGHLSKILLIEW